MYVCIVYVHVCTEMYTDRYVYMDMNQRTCTCSYLCNHVFVSHYHHHHYLHQLSHSLCFLTGSLLSVL